MSFLYTILPYAHNFMQSYCTHTMLYILHFIPTCWSYTSYPHAPPYPQTHNFILTHLCSHTIPPTPSHRLTYFYITAYSHSIDPPSYSLAQTVMLTHIIILPLILSYALLYSHIIILSHTLLNLSCIITFIWVWRGVWSVTACKSLIVCVRGLSEGMCKC